MNLAVLGKATVTNGSGDIRTAACRLSDQQRPRLAQRGIEHRRTPRPQLRPLSIACVSAVSLPPKSARMSSAYTVVTESANQPAHRAADRAEGLTAMNENTRDHVGEALRRARRSSETGTPAKERSMAATIAPATNG